MSEDLRTPARPQYMTGPLVILWANRLAHDSGPLSALGWSRLCRRLEQCPTVAALHREVDRIAQEWSRGDA